VGKLNRRKDIQKFKIKTISYGLSRHAVDVILWRYGADKGFRW
jgi:hypothetical protein